MVKENNFMGRLCLNDFLLLFRISDVKELIMQKVLEQVSLDDCSISPDL